MRSCDFNGVRAGGELDSAAHVINAVSGGNGVVLVGLEDVSVDAALECAGLGEGFAVKHDARIGAEGLEIDPVVAGMGNGERALP
jgi:hypothetical protein